MNLYLIEQDENDDYDTYDSAVVAAESEEAARDIHPSDKPMDWKRAAKDRYGPWAFHRERVTVTLIGVAAEGVAPGVVCASFNGAG